MNRYNQARGRGTGERAFFPRVRIKSEGRKGTELISANSEITVSTVPRPLDPSEERAALAAYLAANPGMTVRDWKGKGFDPFHPFDKDHVGPNEEPWHALDSADVRKAATGRPARFLSKAERQAAARDTALIWDEASRSYRTRIAIDPRPSSLPTGDDGEGARKVRAPMSSRPAVATRKTANTSSRGRARRHHGETS
jgi:hypothetical protein